MPGKKFFVAGIQHSCDNEPKMNLEQGLKLLDKAVDRGAKIVCFPELFTTKWFPAEKNEDNLSLSVDEDSESIQMLKDRARVKNITIIAPVYEKSVDGGFNSAFVIFPDGSITGKYRKIHVPDIPSYHEKYYFKPGDLGFTIFNVDGFKFGIQICWDIFFPEGPRILGIEGVHAIFCPTASAFQSQSRWLNMICAHAIANNVYMIRINRLGDEGKQNFYGDSFAVNPFGELIVQPVGKTDAVVLVEIDTSLVETARETFAFYSNRQPKNYTPIVHENISKKTAIS